MGIKQIYREYINKLEKKSQKIRVKKQWIYEIYEILLGKESVSQKSLKLSIEQKKAMDSYWKNKYGKTIPYFWHKKYLYYSGKFCVDYFPEILYTTKLEPLMNPDKVAKIYENKALVELLFYYKLGEKIVVPKTVCGCSDGYFFDEFRNPSSLDEVVKSIVSNREDMIIKPSVGGSSGFGVKKIQAGTKYLEAQDIVRSYGNDFIVQNVIRQHESFAKLHEQSVNTVRIISYRVDDKIHVTPSIMRIGCGKSFIDNAHAGGVYIGIQSDGKLGRYAISQNTNDKYEIHPDSKIVFDNYELYGFEKIQRAAIELHKCLPNIGIVNWDFSVDEIGRVVLIECNLNAGSIWLIQNACGEPVFGSDTEYMISKIKENK